MKKILLTLLLATSITATAQVKIGNNASTIATNAMFQVQGTTIAEQFVVLKNGSVGIGTTTPTQRLDLNGHVKFGDGSVSYLVANARPDFGLVFQNDRNLILYDYGAAIWTTGTGVSDIRTKTNIVAAKSVLNQVKDMSVIEYNYKPELNLGNERHIGFSAQDIIKRFPEFEIDLTYYDKKSDRYLVNYDKITILAIKAIQEQQLQIESLKFELAKLKKNNKEFLLKPLTKHKKRAASSKK